MHIDAIDDLERRLARAAEVVPRPAQLAWQQRPVTGFTHFGMNTCTDREWGSGAESPQWFDPAEIDTDQWMRAMRAAGVSQAMMTAKHHDGFVLYPTRYSRHSVVASPWWHRGGEPNPRGDVLGAYVASARAHGLKVGVYLSPADGAELPEAVFRRLVERARASSEAGVPHGHEERATLDDRDRAPAGHGRYGSGSAPQDRVIPTLVEGDDRADAVRSGELPSFSVRVDDYNAYYLNQLYEIFTQYGPIDELWLDGANPWADSGADQDYDFRTWFEVITALSPETVTFAGPAGVRWVGNEDGCARETEWSPLPITADPRSAHNEGLLLGGAVADDLGSRDRLADPSVRELVWAPAEADVSLRPGWFWHPDEAPKTPVELVEIYRRTVGRNATLLLNVPPARDGRVPPEDVAALAAFGDAITRTEADNLVNSWQSGPWSPPGGATTGALEVPLRAGARFDQIQLGEDIGHGQRVEAVAVLVRVAGSWVSVADLTTIGARRIITLDQPIEADALRVVVDQARAQPRLSLVAVYQTVPVQG